MSRRGYVPAGIVSIKRGTAKAVPDIFGSYIWVICGQALPHV